MASPKKQGNENLLEFNVGGKYDVHGPVLGKGAWSEVRRCRPTAGYECPVPGVSDLVVKMIDKAHLVKLTRGDEAQADGEVQRELNTLSKLPQHPNIAVFIESIKSDSHHHLVFEAAPNGDLCEKILGCPAGKLDPVAARRYTYQMVQSILHCHRAGIAHRDIKPENMLLGSGDMLKLTDFGLAKINPNHNNGSAISPSRSASQNGTTAAASSSSTTATANGLMNGNTNGQSSVEEVLSMAKVLLSKTFPEPEIILCSEVVGTPYYGAPEMFDAKSKGTRYDGYLADAWSLGVVVFIMLTGSFPFSPPKGVTDKETYEALMKATLTVSTELPAAASDFIKKLLLKDPAKRMKLSQALDHEWLEPLLVEEDMKQAAKLAAASSSSKTMENGNGNSNNTSGTGFHEASYVVQKQVMRLIRRQTLHAQAVEAVVPAPSQRPPTSSSGGIASSRSSSVTGGSKRATSPTVSHVRSRPGMSAGQPSTVSPAPSPNRRGATPTRQGARLAGTSPGPTARAATPTGSRNTPTPSSSLPTTPKVSSNGGLTPKPLQRGPISPAPGVERVGARATPQRANSPLARSSPIPTIRRGTPLRTVAGNSLGSSTPTGAAPRRGLTTPSPTPGSVRPSSATPVRRPGTMPLKSPTPNSPGTSTAAAVGAGAAPLAVTQKVIYKGKDATVRFRGETGFAPGLWLGLEMASTGGEGLHDGRSYVDKVRYFECPKGHGVFVRESQVTRSK